MPTPPPADPPPSGTEPRTTVVVVTMNRAAGVVANLRTLERACPGVPVIVVDNGSTDGTADRVRSEHPGVTVIALPRNEGAAGRTHGVRAARTPYVAFADDDSWWSPDALDTAANLFDAHPRLGLLACRILVEPGGRLDPVCRQMAASPLGEVPGVGPAVLGFVACGCVVRREAYLAVGGFHPRFGIGGEEELLAIDLSAAGWTCAYRDDVTAHHAPDSTAHRPQRARRLVRNDLWTHWLRRPAGAALRPVPAVLHGSLRDRPTRQGLVDAVAGLGWVLRERRVVERSLEARLALLERADVPSAWMWVDGEEPSRDKTPQRM